MNRAEHIISQIGLYSGFALLVHTTKQLVHNLKIQLVHHNKKATEQASNPIGIRRDLISDYIAKPTSLVADFELIPDTILKALTGSQIEPLIL